MRLRMLPVVPPRISLRLTPLFGQQNRTFKVDAVAVTTGKS
jgi:hypothetical protein